MIDQTLTEARVCSGDQHHSVRQITSLQDLQSRGVPVVAFGFHLQVLNSEGLTRVKVCCALVDVADDKKEENRETLAIYIYI